MDLLVLNEFGKRYAKAWCSQNTESVAACFAEDGSLQVNEDTPAVNRGPVAGRDARPPNLVVASICRTRPRARYSLNGLPVVIRVSPTKYFAPSVCSSDFSR